MLGAAFLLWRLAGILRRDGSGGKRRFAGPTWSSDAVPTQLALAFEWAAFAAVLFAAVAALAAGSQPGLLWDWEKAGGVGLLMAAAAFLVMLVPRWKQEWLVYLANS